MNLRPILMFAAATLFAATAQAHDCTGGAEGGMDATGNQCNEPAPAQAAAPAAAKPAARSPNAPAGAKSATRAKDSAPDAGHRLARVSSTQGR